jgi:hypothetical protein
MQVSDSRNAMSFFMAAPWGRLSAVSSWFLGLKFLAKAFMRRAAVIFSIFDHRSSMRLLFYRLLFYSDAWLGRMVP